MRKNLTSALTGALLVAAAANAIPTDAVAMSAAPPSTVSLSSPVDTVWYRRWGGGYRYGGYYRRPYYGGYYRRGYSPGAAVAAGVGMGLLGAGLAAAGSGYYGGYYPSYNYDYYYPSYGYGYYNYPSYNYWGW